MKLLVSNFGPSLMVGFVPCDGDEPDACEVMANKFHNLGYFTSDKYYNGYAVVDSLDDVRKVFRIHHYLDLIREGESDDDAELFALDLASNDMKNMVEFTAAPYQSQGKVHSVSDGNDPADSSFD